MDWYPLFNSLRIAAISTVVIFFSGIAAAYYIAKLPRLAKGALDVVMTLPLVVLGFERLMRTGRFLGYVLPLAYALYANYYIGFMLCLFMVLYYVVFALRSRRTPAEQLRGFRRFAVGSALGGGLVMFLLIPVYLALQHTSAAGGGLPELASNFDMF